MGRGGADHVPGAGRREVRGRPARDARRRRDQRAQVPHRRRLLALGRLARPAAGARRARRGGDRCAPVQRRARSRRARDPGGGARPDEAARRGGRRRLRRRARRERRAHLPRRRPGARGAGRAGAAALPQPARLGRQAGAARPPDDGHEPRRRRSSRAPTLEVVRTPASLSALTRAAAGDGVVFAGSVGGGFVFPDFLPAYDGVASLCKLLELLAPVERRSRSSSASCPNPTVVHRQVRCPWARKGAVMRILTERMKGKKVDTLDGIKVFEKRGWAQVLPDPDEPLVHVYAEGKTGRGDEPRGGVPGPRRGGRGRGRGRRASEASFRPQPSSPG